MPAQLINAMDITIDTSLQTRPAIDGLLKTLCVIFLLSGLACEIYVLFRPVRRTFYVSM